jgi:glycosyltransferase involved in cell wall biosynthesis
VATVSDSSKNEIIKYLNVPEQKIVVAKNAINKDVFYPRHKNEVEKVKRKHGLKNYFIFIGNIEPRKNIQNLIAAFEEFSKEHKGMTLFIVGGDGWLNEKIIKDVKDAKKNDIDVRMSDGYISPDEDLPALITGAKALIQPSWHEGFGMPVTQALACKTPVICSNIAVFREITAGWGGWVYFFNPKDIHNLAKILSKIDKPTQKNKAKIQGWDVTALKLLNVCYNMTNERKK